MTGAPGESSAAIARRVIRAVEIQRERLDRLFPGRGNAGAPGAPENHGFAGRPEGLRRNARLPPGLVGLCCPLSGRGEQALKTAVSKLALSGRAYHGILRLARTIADLEGRDTIDAVQVLEAVEHRRRGDDPYDIVAGNWQVD
jgi:magnesium chelatase family protein